MATVLDDNDDLVAKQGGGDSFLRGRVAGQRPGRGDGRGDGDIGRQERIVSLQRLDRRLIDERL